MKSTDSIAMPPAPAPRWQARVIGIAIGVLVLASFLTLDTRWSEFLSLDAMSQMARFGRSFFPPQLSAPFLDKIWPASLETLAMSLLGTLLAVVFGLALALPASASGRPGAGVIRSLARGLLNVLRSIPELVWASLLLIAAGLGPFPGTLALALHTTGVLGRLYAENIENADPAPAAALQVRGVGRLQVFLYATLPQITPQLISYALYRWENNIRAAAVLGVVGAGGLGQMLYYHLGLFHMRETCTVLLAMIALVGAVDALSYLARRTLNR